MNEGIHLKRAVGSAEIPRKRTTAARTGSDRNVECWHGTTLRDMAFLDAENWPMSQRAARSLGRIHWQFAFALEINQ